MAMSPENLDEMQTLLKKARQKDLSFGLCLGKKPEDNVFFLDLKKSGEVMARKAKAEGETGKLTYGTVGVKGKIATLMVEGKMLPGLAKNMKVFMTKNGIKMKVVITDPSGQVLESDGDEDEDDNDAVTDANAVDQSTDDTQGHDAPDDDGNDDVNDNADPAAGKWDQVAAALGPLAAKFDGASDPRAAQIVKAWAAAEAAAGKGDYKSAMGVAVKLKPLLVAGPADGASNSAPPNEAGNPDRKKWEAVQSPLEALYTKALGNNPANRSQLEAAWGMALEKAEGGDYAAALTIAGKLKPRLDEAANAAASGQQDEIPKDVVPFQKSRVLWSNTRKKMQAEMEKLEKAIVDVCADDPELAPVAEEASGLNQRLQIFDDQLEDLLDQITGTAEGPDRTRLKADANAKIREFQAALQDDFFKEVDGENGFVNVAVTATATQSLQAIANVLAK
ncbi:hypothetical protein [Pseudosulfitobacter koreensis]|uniref:Uncharacterized protein n=1 Tax=Pseudosulfitobacter koreensis TaxID=2968472 RepID=A0ABT1Z2H9_9RHOB|nr:hypothetical protein [Pseudosulfitobacter koreense]MCR8827339.1 hypothetical protein [Pseudosulfitobacter koreense]